MSTIRRIAHMRQSWRGGVVKLTPVPYTVGDTLPPGTVVCGIDSATYQFAGLAPDIYSLFVMLSTALRLRPAELEAARTYWAAVDKSVCAHIARHGFSANAAGAAHAAAHFAERERRP